MNKYALVVFTLLALSYGCAKDSEMPEPMPTVQPTSQPTVTPRPTPNPTTDANVDRLFSAPAAIKPMMVKFAESMINAGLKEGVDMVPLFEDGPKLDISLASLDNLGAGVIGLCAMGGSYREVTFDPDFWNYVPDSQKLLLFYHELGHCILNRRHDTSSGTIPDILKHSHEKSIMYPLIFRPSQYSDHLKWYNSELFNDLATLPGGPSLDVCQ